VGERRYCHNGYDGCAVNETATNWTVLARAPPPPAPPTTDCTDAALPCAAAFSDAAWRTVSVPHDFINEGAYTPTADREHGYLPFNVSWYRCHFTVAAAPVGGAVWVDFDFPYFLHNVTAADGTPALRLGGGENVLAVRVDALSEQEGWWGEGGGIYRHVTLTVASAVHVAPWGVFVPSTVTGPVASGALGSSGSQTADALVMPQVDVSNVGAATAALQLSTLVFDARGALVANRQDFANVSAGATVRFTSKLPIAGASLWNVAPAPPLYTLRMQVWVGGALVDEVDTAFGIRSAVWSPTRGFELNGVKTPVQGFSMREGAPRADRASARARANRPLPRSGLTRARARRPVLRRRRQRRARPRRRVPHRAAARARREHVALVVPVVPLSRGGGRPRGHDDVG